MFINRECYNSVRHREACRPGCQGDEARADQKGTERDAGGSRVGGRKRQVGGPGDTQQDTCLSVLHMLD